MESKLYGSWKNIDNLLNNLEDDLISESESLAHEEAINIQNSVKQKILSQTENWSPLKESTIREKGHSKALYETGQLVESIKVESIDSLTYKITPEGSHSSGLTNSELATIHEYGTDKIPPRPFIQPTWDEHKSDVEQKMCNLVKKTINKYR